MAPRKLENEEQPDARHQPGAWDVMTIVAGFAALGGFVSGARASTLGWFEIILFGFVGITVGVFLVWVIRLFGFWLSRVILRNHVAGGEMHWRTTFALALMHVLALVWILISAMLGGAIAALVIGLLR